MQATVRLSRAIDDDDLRAVAAQNPGWRVDRIGGAIVMAPTTSDGARRSALVTARLVFWAERNGFIAFDSNGGFTLPGGDVLAADAALVREARWTAVAPALRDTFAPLVPDVVVELVSKSDRVAAVARTCELWVAAGAGFVVMLDPYAPGMRTWGDAPSDFPTDWHDVLR